jgi:outer membrane protein assembly factor BamB
VRCPLLLCLAGATLGSCRRESAPAEPPRVGLQQLPQRCSAGFPLSVAWSIEDWTPSDLGAGEAPARPPILGVARVEGDGRIFVGAKEWLMAVDGEQRVRWAFRAEAAVESRPLVVGDTVYLTDILYNVFALNAATGEQRWKKETRGWNFSSPVADRDGNILIASWDGVLYAFEPDGEIAWRYQTDGWIYSTPLVDPEGNITFGSGDDGVYSLAPDGTFRWRFDTRGEVNASPIRGPDGTIYVGSYDGSFYALDPDDGAERWRWRTGAGIAATATLDGDRLLVAATDGTVAALALDGEPLWTRKLAGPIVSAPLVTPRGRIVTTSNAEEICVLAGDGQPLGCVDTGWPAWAPAARRGDQIVASVAGALFGLRECD